MHKRIYDLSKISLINCLRHPWLRHFFVTMASQRHITRRHALRRCAPRPPRPRYGDGRSGTFSPPLRYGENVAYAGNVVRHFKKTFLFHSNDKINILIDKYDMSSYIISDESNSINP